MRIGQGYDVHQLVDGRKLIIGGIHIPYEKGLLGHSDADVLLHSINDALFGALALGDIGTHFPDTDPQWKNADSKELLFKSNEIVMSAGYHVINIDATIVAEKPKMKPYIPQMTSCIARLLQCPVDCVSVKATTSEKMGFIGRQEGIAAMSVILLGR
ncbi:MAG: 2-C-methyl-D-erythritol 2,4-cyclodiphosphate synthase [Balneolales bacterium]|nr:2-C-methyl-D-erythritol 2,4-cyclodiphosphate synthase [Balneolales bacterium]